MKTNKAAEIYKAIMPFVAVVAFGLAFCVMFLNGLDKELKLQENHRAEEQQPAQTLASVPEGEPVANGTPCEALNEPQSEEKPPVGSYAYYCEEIKQAAILAGCDYKLAVAVARLETGNFKSSAFVKGNNYGGIGSKGPKKYESKEQGLAVYIKLITNYYNKYGDDVEAMAKRYCPANAEKWAKSVRHIMGEVK